MARVAVVVSEALKTMPAEAVPGMLEALLQATGTRPSDLLSQLIQVFREVMERSKTDIDANWQYFGGFNAAILFLLKFKDSDVAFLDKVVWTVWIPLLQKISVKESAHSFQVIQSLAEAVAFCDAWAFVESSLLPFCLASLHDCLMSKGEGMSCDWKYESLSKKHMELGKLVTLEEAGRCYEENILPVSVACQLLGTLLTKAVNIFGTLKSDQLNLGKEAKDKLCLEHHFCQAVISIFWHPALLMLSQSPNHSIRCLAVEIFLPPLLRAANYLEECLYQPRPSPSEQVWICCKSLFSQQCLERRDAYMALTLLKSFLIPSVSEPNKILLRNDIGKIFDVRDDPAFWDELRAGLVDEDQLTRKRAMYLLKAALDKPGRLLKYNLPQNTQKSSGPGFKEKQNLNESTMKSLTKRERQEMQESASLGIGAFLGEETQINELNQWTSFCHLYEILDEYGIHLVEAAWKCQIFRLMEYVVQRAEKNNILTKDISFIWTTVLWDRGFMHSNPQVRRLILQSFLELNWESMVNISTALPEEFVLGPLLLALNDPANHKDFGMGGTYESQTSKGAAKFISIYSSKLQQRACTRFVTVFAKSFISQSPCRAGLMTLANCIQEASVRPFEKALSFHITPTLVTSEKSQNLNAKDDAFQNTQSTELLEALRLVMEECKCHYNPRYRAKVYLYIFTAALNLVMLSDISVNKFGQFLTSIPRELFAKNGSLTAPLHYWLRTDSGRLKDQPDPQRWIAEGLRMLMNAYIKAHNCHASSYEIKEEELDSWKTDSERWARLLVIGLLEEQQQLHLLEFIEQNTSGIDKRAYACACIPVKLLILVSSLLNECKEYLTSEITIHHPENTQNVVEQMREMATDGNATAPLAVHVTDFLASIMIELVSYASRATAVFWDYDHEGPLELPLSVTGKLGGPSQRRLPAWMNSAVLKAVLAIRTVASCTLWLHQFKQNKVLEFTASFLWSFAWKVVTTGKFQLEMGAEVYLGAFEALTFVCDALAVTMNPSIVRAFMSGSQLDFKSYCSAPFGSATIVDGLARSVLAEMNGLIEIGGLARSRVAIAVHHKWCCLDSLLSITNSSVCEKSKVQMSKQADTSAILNSTMQEILDDAINSLEHAGEDSLLYILRSVRWLLDWNILEYIGMKDDSGNRKYEVVWALVRSGWTAFSNSNKRRVVLIAAFLSALLHPSVFSDATMHKAGDNMDIGPMKWLTEKLMEQGLRSPRTMRLTTLQLTGLWLEFPVIACLYILELKSLSLHGGESVDEELDGEIGDNKTAAREYSILLRSCDQELTEAFTNTEMCVRVMVAVMMHKLAQELLYAKTSRQKKSYGAAQPALHCGQCLLLELLAAAANDDDLSKELYKKKSAIHRRKIRAWQMLCILSHFVNDDVIPRVLSMLELCLFRNNMASVRQYIDIFALQVYLRFPSLVYSHLIPMLKNYNLKTQALSSYVSIASNVLIHISPMAVQKDMLKEILPAILPYITSHHHNLRSFSQVIIYQILNLFSITKLHSAGSEGSLNLEQKCLQSLAGYLEENSDCTRMRTSVEKYLNILDPVAAATPRGMFCNQFGETDVAKITDTRFECAPTSMLDQIGHFLTEARDGLRQTMTANSLAISAQDYAEHSKLPGCQLSPKNGYALDNLELDRDVMSNMDEYQVMHTCNDFQRKMKPFKDKMLGADHSDEDEVLLRTFEAKMKDLLMTQSTRQKLIVVASLLERVPNIAGLARTCEVFKISSLAVADRKILDDKQFQMISVTAEQWVPIIELPEEGLEQFLQHKKKKGYRILGLEQTAYSIPVSEYPFPERVVLVLGREKDGIPVEIIQILDACIEIPQLGMIRSLNVHVSGALAIWEYTKYHQRK